MKNSSYVDGSDNNLLFYTEEEGSQGCRESSPARHRDQRVDVQESQSLNN